MVEARVVGTHAFLLHPSTVVPAVPLPIRDANGEETDYRLMRSSSTTGEPL